MGRCGTGKHIVNSNLTPEEDAIGDPIEDSDEIDDSLPADLWFRVNASLLPLNQPPTVPFPP
jgi:hypothetical protein